MSDSESLRRLRRLLSLLEGEPPPGDSVQLWEQLTQHVTNLREELREMQDRCATLFNIASAGRAILVEGRIVDCNHELAAMLATRASNFWAWAPRIFPGAAAGWTPLGRRGRPAPGGSGRGTRAALLLAPPAQRPGDR
ncbi:hypothetical protein HS125_08550 [bacterium]|nr:hypothetical protein [bacterium]